MEEPWISRAVASHCGGPSGRSREAAGFALQLFAPTDAGGAERVCFTALRRSPPASFALALDAAALASAAATTALSDRSPRNFLKCLCAGFVTHPIELALAEGSDVDTNASTLALELVIVPGSFAATFTLLLRAEALLPLPPMLAEATFALLGEARHLRESAESAAAAAEATAAAAAAAATAEAERVRALAAVAAAATAPAPTAPVPALQPQPCNDRKRARDFLNPLV